MSLDGITYANKSQILKNPALAQNEWSDIWKWWVYGGDTKFSSFL